MKHKCSDIIFDVELESDVYELTFIENFDYNLTLENDADYDITLDVEGAREYSLDIIQDESLDYLLDSGVAIVSYIEGEIYDGPYTVTPSCDPQILNTNGFILTKDITVGAIPSNYGLISWNGAILSVS